MTIEWSPPTAAHGTSTSPSLRSQTVSFRRPVQMYVSPPRFTTFTPTPMQLSGLGVNGWSLSMRRTSVATTSHAPDFMSYENLQPIACTKPGSSGSAQKDDIPPYGAGPIQWRRNLPLAASHALIRFGTMSASAT